MYKVPEEWKLSDFLELSNNEKLKWLYNESTEAMEKAEKLPEASASDNGKFLGVAEGGYELQELPEELPSVTASNNGEVLEVDNGEWKAIQEHYVSGDKFANSEGASWFAGTFSSTTTFRFTMTLPKTRHNGTASVTKAIASIYLYNGTNKASEVDFKNTANYIASVTLLSDSLASVQLISPTAFSSVTAGSTGSVYFAQGNFEISFA